MKQGASQLTDTSLVVGQQLYGGQQRLDFWLVAYHNLRLLPAFASIDVSRQTRWYLKRNTQAVTHSFSPCSELRSAPPSPPIALSLFLLL